MKKNYVIINWSDIAELPETNNNTPICPRGRIIDIVNSGVDIEWEENPLGVVAKINIGGKPVYAFIDEQGNVSRITGADNRMKKFIRKVFGALICAFRKYQETDTVERLVLVRVHDKKSRGNDDDAPSSSTSIDDQLVEMPIIRAKTVRSRGNDLPEDIEIVRSRKTKESNKPLHQRRKSTRTGHYYRTRTRDGKDWVRDKDGNVVFHWRNGSNVPGCWVGKGSRALNEERRKKK